MSTIKQPPGAGGEPIPGGAGADPAMAGPAPLGFEERLLAELQMVVAERAAGTTTAERPGQAARPGTAGRAGVRRAGGPWPARRFALTGGACVSLAAGLAVALTVTSGNPPPASGGFAAPASPAAVLHNAALAALQMPAGAPRPDQFVYSKVYERDVGAPGPSRYQEWLSVSGTRFGLKTEQQPGGRTTTSPEPACIKGWLTFPKARHPIRGLADKFHFRCTPQSLAAYLPAMPSRPAALRAYLYATDRDRKRGDFSPVILVWSARAMLVRDYLTPAQRAGMYEVLAQAPGSVVVPKAATVLGRTGVGVRWTSGTGHRRSSFTFIFQRGTYRLLGINSSGYLADGVAGVAVTGSAVVDRAGQLP